MQIASSLSKDNRFSESLDFSGENAVVIIFHCDDC